MAANALTPQNDMPRVAGMLLLRRSAHGGRSTSYGRGWMAELRYRWPTYHVPVPEKETETPSMVYPK